MPVSAAAACLVVVIWASLVQHQACVCSLHARVANGSLGVCCCHVACLRFSAAVLCCLVQLEEVYVSIAAVAYMPCQCALFEQQPGRCSSYPAGWLFWIPIPYGRYLVLDREITGMRDNHRIVTLLSRDPALDQSAL